MHCHRSTLVLAACVTCSSLVLGANRSLTVEPAIAYSSNFSRLEESVGSTVNGVAIAPASQLQIPTANKTKSAAIDTAKPNAAKPSSEQKQLFWLIAASVITIAIAGGGIFFLLKWFSNPKKAVEKPKSRPQEEPAGDGASTAIFTASNVSTELDPPDNNNHSNGHNLSTLTVSLSSSSETQPPTVNLPVNNTSRLSKIDIVNELIKDLQATNPQKRRKAIWELAQQGDSRAIQPLVDLLIDSDSKQRSLILEAVSQIGTKSLKPVNRALAISLQDDNAEVRKNAIRDLTRIYELVAQTTQILCHATDDPDPEVQETARWAMNQLSRIRTSATLENLPPSQSSPNLSENHKQEP